MSRKTCISALALLASSLFLSTASLAQITVDLGGVDATVDANVDLGGSPDVSVDADASLGNTNATVDANVDLGGSPDVSVDVDANVGNTNANVDADVDLGGSNNDLVDADVTVGSQGSGGDILDADVNIGGSNGPDADVRVSLLDGGIDASVVLDLIGRNYAGLTLDIGGNPIRIIDVTRVANADNVLGAINNNGVQLDVLRSIVGNTSVLPRALRQVGFRPQNVVGARVRNNGSLDILVVSSLRGSAGRDTCQNGNFVIGADDIRAIANASNATVTAIVVCPGGAVNTNDSKIAQLQAVVDANQAIEADVISAGYSVNDVVGARMLSGNTVRLYVD